ncbi:ATP-binding protein [Saccharothrix stipae]
MKRDEVDYFRFVDGVVEAKRLIGRERMDRLGRALQEWGDDPLNDLGLRKFNLSRERAILDDQHRNAMADYLTAAVECGESAHFRSHARRALKKWPRDPTLVTLIAEVLASTHSEAEARAFLVKHIEENGDSNGDLGEIQAKFAPFESGVGPVLAVPRQLPGQRGALIGRDIERNTLTRLLFGAESGVARVVVVNGMPGVGKTCLTCTWAAEVEKEFPGGTLYADLNGYGPLNPEEPAQILARMLLDLGVDAPTSTLDGLITAFRSATTDRSLLVVLDNARDSAQVRPLLPGTGSAAIVTSRVRLGSLTVREGAHQFTLEPLCEADALSLLTKSLSKSLGEVPVRQAGCLVEDIVSLVGRLPLALAVVAARVIGRPTAAVRKIRDELRETKTRLDALVHGRDADLDVRLALSYSYSGLSDATADLLPLLALHPGPTISLPALTALAGRNCETEVDELVTAHLLAEPVFERFAMHDLIRDYARELVESRPAEETAQITRRVYEFLLQNTWTCDRTLVPGRDLPVLATSEMQVVSPRTPEEAMAWLDVEYPTITAALRQAEEQRAYQYTWLLAMALVTYQWRRSRFADAARYLSSAADASERVASLSDQAMVYRMLAGSRWNMEQYTLAGGAQRRSLLLSRQAADHRGVAYGHIGMAALHLGEHEHDDADAEYEKALELFRELGDSLGEADAVKGIGQSALARGNLDMAFQHCSAALRLYEQSDDVNGQAGALAALGDVHAARAEFSRAAAIYDAAVSLYRDMTRHSHEARTLVSLASALRLDGRTTEGRFAMARAHDLYAELDDDAGLAVVKAMMNDS